MKAEGVQANVSGKLILAAFWWQDLRWSGHMTVVRKSTRPRMAAEHVCTENAAEDGG